MEWETCHTNPSLLSAPLVMTNRNGLMVPTLTLCGLLRSLACESLWSPTTQSREQHCRMNTFRFCTQSPAGSQHAFNRKTTCIVRRQRVKFGLDEGICPAPPPHIRCGGSAPLLFIIDLSLSSITVITWCAVRRDDNALSTRDSTR